MKEMKGQTLRGPKRWSEFQRGFRDTYFASIASNDLLRFSSMKPDEFMDFGMVVFYGNPSKPLMRMFVERALMGIFDLRTIDPRSTTFSVGKSPGGMVPYTSSSVHVAIEFDGMDSETANSAVCEFFAKHLVVSRCYERRKHVVVMYNIDLMPNQCALALRKLVETSCTNVVVIATTSNISRLNEALRSRCVFVRCNVDVQRERDVIDALLMACGERRSTPTGRPRSTLAARICSADPHNHTNLAESMVVDFANNRLWRCKSVLDAVPCIKRFITDVSRFKLGAPDILKAAVAMVAEDPCVDVAAVRSLVDAAARHEHASLLHRKPNMALEAFFLHMYDCICMVGANMRLKPI
jgi:hypothetical protein